MSYDLDVLIGEDGMLGEKFYVLCVLFVFFYFGEFLFVLL